MPDRKPEPKPLVLADEPRMDEFEIKGPDGRIVVVTHNLDTGECEYEFTDRTELPRPDTLNN